MDKIITTKNTVILKPTVSLEEINVLVDKKKIGLFGTPFTRPKSDEINVSSPALYFEPIWKIIGEYNVDFYRANTHQISTDPHVKEIVIGTGIFPADTEYGAWKKFKSSIKIGDKKNKIELPVEEHVLIDREYELCFNSQGQQIEFKFNIKPKNIENFPDVFTSKNNMHFSELTEDQIIDNYVSVVKSDLGEFLRIVSERLVITVFEQIFLPVYEIRLTDSKNTTKILQVDGITSKIL